MDAAIVAIGSELTTGRIVDTNSAWLSRRLLALGIKPLVHLAVPDDKGMIVQALREAAARAKAIVVTGGLGPTEDDLTRDAVAQALGVALDFHAPSLERIQQIFKTYGRPMSPSNRRQAEFPQGAKVLENDVGTAPAFTVEVFGARIWCLPGVPREMFHLFDRHVEPHLRELAGLPEGSLVERVLRTCGIAESALGEQTADLVPKDDPNAEIAWCVQDNEGTILLTFTVRDPKDPGAAAARADSMLARARERLGRRVCVVGTKTLPARVLDLLGEKKRTLATAESCTGGRVASWLTAIPGASKVFFEGAVTYTNDSKHRRLGVPEELIAKHGAVSSEVAIAMAEGIRRTAGTDYGIGITGIAGPDGGTATKPVGLVYFAVSGPRGTASYDRRFWGGRDRVQILASSAALDALRLALEDEGS